MNFGSFIYKGNPNNSSLRALQMGPPLARLKNRKKNNFLYKELMNSGSSIYKGNPNNSLLRGTPDGAPPSQIRIRSKE